MRKSKQTASNKKSIGSKVDYVLDQAKKGAGDHHCHWPGCEELVPPAMWGCSAHWFKLPFSLRNRIWETYRPGQEISKTPSREYLEAANDVEKWILINYPPKKKGKKKNA